jgi:hypothetical protein
MRATVVFGVVAALWGTSAGAQQLVQTVNGTQRVPGTLSLFDPSLGWLSSVEIDGTIGLWFGLVRNYDDPLPAVDISHTTTGQLWLGYGPGGPIPTITDIPGEEIYQEGQIFGSLSFSGPVSETLTGSGLTPFIATAGATSSAITPYVDSSGLPVVGQVYSSPGDVFTEALTITYNYSPLTLPEPSTWAMMLLGFFGIGVAFRCNRLQSPHYV